MNNRVRSKRSKPLLKQLVRGIKHGFGMHGGWLFERIAANTVAKLTSTKHDETART